MRETLLMLVALCVVALLSPPSVAPMHATKPEPVEGTMECEFEITEEWWVDGHKFFEATEWETWMGDIEGESTSSFTDLWFDHPDGPVRAWLVGTFTGTVLGKSGTMVFRLVGWRYPGEGWYGQWVILSGTDELENLHGHGTFWGPGANDPSIDIFYSGFVC